MPENVILERRDGIAVLTINRPERRNAYSYETADEILAACDTLDGDLESRVLIITGAGPAFCAGLDLDADIDIKYGRLGPVQSRYRLQAHLASMVVRLREIPQPVIAAVHGAAAGGGLALAAAADIRIADVTARFSAAFIKLGLSAGDDGCTWFLPRILGPSAAAELLYTGRFVGAEEALHIGLVSQVVPDGEHLQAANQLASEIVANSPFGVRMTKELLNFSLGAPSLRQMIELENRTQVVTMMTGDFAEGWAAVGERRAPDYQDR